MSKVLKTIFIVVGLFTFKLQAQTSNTIDDYLGVWVNGYSYTSEGLAYYAATYINIIKHGGTYSVSYKYYNNGEVNIAETRSLNRINDNTYYWYWPNREGKNYFIFEDGIVKFYSVANSGNMDPSSGFDIYIREW